MTTFNESTAATSKPIRPNGLEFSVTTLYLSLLAAIATAATTALSLELWAMFMGWTCFATGAGSIKRGVAAVGCQLIGLLLGMGAAVAVRSLDPALGVLALPTVVFLLAAITMLSLLTPPLDIVPGYFLGMTTYFASGLEPGTAAFIHLGSANLIGATGSWLFIAGPALCSAGRGAAARVDGK